MLGRNGTDVCTKLRLRVTHVAALWAEFRAAWYLDFAPGPN